MTNATAIPLLTTRTGGISFAQILLLMGALGCIGIQIAMLLQPATAVPGSLAARFLPGILGGMILLLGLLVWGRKGSSSLSMETISGKTSGGKAYSFPLSTLAAPELGRGALVLRDAASGKIVLQDRLPEMPHYLGTMWLLQTYPDLPAAFWQAFASQTGPTPIAAVRSFVEQQGRTAFLDAGCVAVVQGQHYYFPTTTTQPFVQPGAGQDRLSTQVLSQPMQLRFDPDPSRLPMARFVQALSATPLPAAQADAHLQNLLDTHGGCAVNSSGNGWEGECAGYAVEIMAGQ
jgi:hypothetical protein